jgi:hypothetical protein
MSVAHSNDGAIYEPECLWLLDNHNYSKFSVFIQVMNLWVPGPSSCLISVLITREIGLLV